MGQKTDAAKMYQYFNKKTMQVNPLWMMTMRKIKHLWESLTFGSFV